MSLRRIFAFTRLTSGLDFVFRGDTTNSNLQNMEPMPETDEEQVPEDLGKLTVVDKARTGRVCVKLDLSMTGEENRALPLFSVIKNVSCSNNPNR